MHESCEGGGFDEIGDVVLVEPAGEGDVRQRDEGGARWADGLVERVGDDEACLMQAGNQLALVRQAERAGLQEFSVGLHRHDGGDGCARKAERSLEGAGQRLSKDGLADDVGGLIDQAGRRGHG